MSAADWRWYRWWKGGIWRHPWWPTEDYIRVGSMSRYWLEGKGAEYGASIVSEDGAAGEGAATTAGAGAEGIGSKDDAEGPASRWTMPGAAVRVRTLVDRLGRLARLA